MHVDFGPKTFKNKRARLKNVKKPDIRFVPEVDISLNILFVYPLETQKLCKNTNFDKIQSVRYFGICFCFWDTFFAIPRSFEGQGQIQGHLWNSLMP